MAEQLGSSTGKLGFGFMRLPKRADGSFDMDQVKTMVDHFMEAGFTYFDTAYVYDDGASERALKESLVDRYPRESFVVATKMCAWQQAEDAKAAKQQFYTSLERTGAGYFDFYLLHNIYEASIEVYLDEQWGIADYFVEQKKNGRIRHLGFSCHGRPETLKRFLDYGARKYAELEQRDPETAALFAGNNIMEFCQIQLNYLDWTLQDAAAKTALLESMNIPIVVMEPLRGGKLAHLNDAQMQQLNASALGGANSSARSAVEWSFRWLLGIPNVKTILSGMSDLAQVEENCRIFQESAPLSEAEE
uniref:aldo/keto reductase n=1 Tax=Enorma massiliensis TaxID=1472761 RepID=UPI003AB3D2A0